VGSTGSAFAEVPVLAVCMHTWVANCLHALMLGGYSVNIGSSPSVARVVCSGGLVHRSVIASYRCQSVATRQHSGAENIAKRACPTRIHVAYSSSAGKGVVLKINLFICYILNGCGTGNLAGGRRGVMTRHAAPSWRRHGSTKQLDGNFTVVTVKS
jgi:hypothetical protein